MMDAFNTMMQDIGLVDLGFKGQPFTWRNNREGEKRIQERLDREIANAEWICQFPSLTITHKLMLGSDHCPLIINMKPRDQSKRRQFRFEGSWLAKQECREIVRETWRMNTGSGRAE